MQGMVATWNGKPMRVSQQEGLDGAFLATGFAFQLGERWPVFNAALGRVFPRAKGIRRAGSAALLVREAGRGHHRLAGRAEMVRERGSGGGHPGRTGGAARLREGLKRPERTNGI